MKKDVLLALTVALSLTACGGGGSASTPGLPSTPQTPVTSPGAPITASAYGTVKAAATLSASGGPQLVASRSHRSTFSTLGHIRAMGLSISKVKVYGYLYPGYAGSTMVQNEQDVTPSNNSVSVTMSFSNVPVGNNEWAIFDFQAVAADGSTFDLGSLAKIVNVGPNGTSITLDQPSTLRFQALATLLANYYVSANDLKTNTSLETQLGQETSSLQADPNTQLYSTTTLASWLQSVAANYAHALTITVPAGATAVSVAADMTDPGEAHLAASFASLNTLIPWYNPNAAFNPFGFNPTSSLSGAPTYASMPAHTPSSSNVTPVTNSYLAAFEAVSGGTVTLPVYGGPLLVGATDPSQPVGIVQHVPATSGATGTVTLGAMTSTALNVPISDPQAAAFNTQPAVALNVLPGTAFTTNYFSVGPNGSGGAAADPVLDTSAFSSTNAAVQVNTWSPFMLPLSDYQLCTVVNQVCAPISSTSNLQVPEDIADDGQHLSYFNWAGTGAATDGTTGVTSNVNGGYSIAWSNGTSFSIKTTTTTWLPNYVQLYMGGLPGQTAVSATATDAGGKTYTASYSSYNWFYLSFPTISNSVKINSLTLTFALPMGSPASGTSYLYMIRSWNQGGSCGNC